MRYPLGSSKAPRADYADRALSERRTPATSIWRLQPRWRVASSVYDYVQVPWGHVNRMRGPVVWVHWKSFWPMSSCVKAPGSSTCAWRNWCGNSTSRPLTPPPARIVLRTHSTSFLNSAVPGPPLMCTEFLQEGGRGGRRENGATKWWWWLTFSGWVTWLGMLSCKVLGLARCLSACPGDRNRPGETECFTRLADGCHLVPRLSVKRGFELGGIITRCC